MCLEASGGLWEGEWHGQISAVMTLTLRLLCGRWTVGTAMGRPSTMSGQRAGHLGRAGSRGTETWSDRGSVWDAALANVSDRIDGGTGEGE